MASSRRRRLRQGWTLATSRSPIEHRKLSASHHAYRLHQTDGHDWRTRKRAGPQRAAATSPSRHERDTSRVRQPKRAASSDCPLPCGGFCALAPRAVRRTCAYTILLIAVPVRRSSCPRDQQLQKKIAVPVRTSGRVTSDAIVNNTSHMYRTTYKMKIASFACLQVS